MRATNHKSSKKNCILRSNSTCSIQVANCMDDGYLNILNDRPITYLLALRKIAICIHSFIPCGNVSYTFFFFLNINVSYTLFGSIKLNPEYPEQSFQKQLSV